MTGMPLVLMYHSVAKFDVDPLNITVTPERFDEQMRWLAHSGLRGVSMRELRDARDAGTAKGLVGLTFDDGYHDFAAEAVPVLVGFGFTATVFAVVGRIGGHNAWDAGYPRKDLMDRECLRRVARAGMEVGSHSLRHVALPGLADADLERELTVSKDLLEDVIGAEVTGFAYPYGLVGRREVEAVRAAGYDYACAIRRSDCTGRHAFPRTYIGEKDGPARLFAKRALHRVRPRRRG